MGLSHRERDRTVVWMAVIRPGKRPDLLIEIARRLPTIRFIVGGAPSLSHWDASIIDDIMRQLRSLPNVDYRGHVAPSEALRIIGEASLFLSTSDGEGFPSVFLEAWELELNCESSNRSRSQNSGLWVRNGDRDC